VLSLLVRWSGRRSLTAWLPLWTFVALLVAPPGPGDSLRPVKDTAPLAPAVRIGELRTVPGELTAGVSVRDLPPGVNVASAEAAVSVDGTALAPTVRPVPATTAANRTRAVVVVFDTSASMAGAPLVAARTAALRYAAALPPDVLLGLVVFADRPWPLLEPTRDRAAFAAALARAPTGNKTALYDSVGRAVDLLGARVPDGDRSVVVLTDGRDTASAEPAVAVRRRLESAPAIVQLVEFRTSAKAPPADPAMREVVGASGGQVLAATDAAELVDAFETIATSTVTFLDVTARVPTSLAGHAGHVRVDVLVGGRRLVATAPVQLAGTPGGGALHPFRAGGSPGWPRIAALGAAAALLAMLVLLAGRPVLSARQRRLRVAQAAAGGMTGAAGGEDAGPGALGRTALAMAKRVSTRRSRSERVALLLDRAGMRLRPHEWLIVEVVTAMAAVAVLGLLLPWWLGLLVGPFLGWLATGAFLRFKVSRRTRAFADQLPDALQMLVGSLRSGFALPQALAALVRDGADPIAGEFGRALAETRLGVELETALEKTAERVDSQDLAWLVMAIRIQREVGGNLAEVLETAVGTMRERARLRRHVRALSAEGRLSAWVLIAMPVGVGAWMFLFRGQYVRPLVTQPLGITMLVAAVILVGLGAFVMSRMVKVEV
jgi:Flp pilus assembly protein TadB/Mg-chelatase subunit ChlD